MASVLEWNEFYRTGRYQNEWHSEIPSAELRSLLATGILPSGAALDVGCGAGTEAVYLAQQGFDVTALDVSAPALQLTEALAERAGVSVTTLCGCVTDTGLASGSFSLINDRSCFHVLPPDLMVQYVSEVHRLLNHDGFLFVRAFGCARPSWNDPKYLIPLDYFIQLFDEGFEIGPIQVLEQGARAHVPVRIAVLRKKP